ncbi:TniQ family protein [Streptomyces sp. 5.8]|uniref:TniQ family protein n=1 Tax=Streptomyces sp. 5.8 TaxID=3406571 RepID=UPI003BB74A20
MNQTRALPLRVAVMPGEGLDSWVEALGRRYGITMATTLRTLGLPKTVLTRQLITSLPVTTLRRIETQAGLPAGRLNTAVVGDSFPFGPQQQRRCRFCPQCLAERDGRWLMNWWLPWVFACTRHGSLLHDTCPGCGEGLRIQMPGHTHRHPAGTCTRGKSKPGCGTSLTDVPALTLDTGHPLLTTQNSIDELLTAADTPRSLWTDLNRCTPWLMHVIDDTELAPMGEMIRRHWRHSTLATTGPARLGQPLAAAVHGVIAHTALPFLAGNNDATAITAIRNLRARHDTRSKIIPRGMTVGQWSHLSPDAHRHFLRATDDTMGALDRVRFSSTTLRAGLPGHGSQQPTERIRHVPQFLWPGWAVRFMPHEGVEHFFRGISAALLLLPGQPRLTARQITDRLSPHLPNLMTITLQRALKSGHPDVLTAICDIAHYLDEYGSPIDYDRRRRLVPDAPITPDQWKQLCFATGTQPGEQLNTKTTQTPRYRNAQRYLHHLLTGADLNDPRHPLAIRTAGDRSRYLTFSAELTLAQRDALRDHATGVLHRLDIDEPLTWEPPQTLADGLDLPGPHPDDIGLEEVRRIVITEQRPPGDAASELGTTLTHIRFALEHVPREPRQWGRSSPTGSWRLREQAKGVLTPDFLQREYTELGKTLTRIATETSIPKHIVLEHADTAGLTIYHSRRPHPIDEAWLREQYLTHKHSTSNIAHQIGTTDETVRRRLQQLGITLRPQGVHSRTVMTAKLGRSIPRAIRAAVEGALHGWLRLHRFQITMAFPNLNTACRYLDIDQRVLTVQFQRLETDIGHQLYHRSVQKTPQRPTTHGRSLLRHLQQPHIRELMNDALTPAQKHPMPDPATIASATATAQYRRRPSPLKPFDDIAVRRLRIRQETLTLLHDLLVHADEESYGTQIHARTGLPQGTVSDQLSRLRDAGWLTCRLEDDESWRNRAPAGRGAGRRRAYYTLTPEGHRAATHEIQTRGLPAPRNPTDPLDEPADKPSGHPTKTTGQDTPSRQV